MEREDAVDLPSSDDKVSCPTGAAAKSLSPAERQLIDAAEYEIVPDVRIRRRDLGVQIVWILRIVAVDTEIEGRRAVINVMRVGVAWYHRFAEETRRA